MKKVINLYKFTPALVVMIMVFLPYIANFFTSNTALLDNRQLYKRPTNLSRSFSKDYEKYYNDTFAFRQKLVKRYIKLQHRFKFDTGQFFYGQGDWMFFDSSKNNDGETLVDYKGEVKFYPEELDKIRDGILNYANYFNKKGIKYFVVVAPNKENVYPEFMPSALQKVRVSDVSRVDEAINYINANGGKAINLKSVLLSAKQDYPFLLYYMTDTHWNKMGAYLGYNEILKELNKQGLKLPIKPLTSDMITEAGRKHFDMSPTYLEMDYNLEYLPNIKSKLVLSEQNGKRLVYHTENALTDKTLLLIRDSFAEDLIPLLNKVFKNVICIQSSRNNYEDMADFVEKYKPDYVIDEVVERKFLKFLKYEM